MANDLVPIFNYDNELTGFESYSTAAIRTAQAFFDSGKFDHQIAEILDDEFEKIYYFCSESVAQQYVEALYQDDLPKCVETFLRLAKNDSLARQLSELFTDKTPAEMLADPEQVKSLPHFKTREVVVFTDSNQLLILQRGPWAASPGEAQSTGGGFIGMVDGRVETVEETIARKLKQKLDIDILPDGEVIDLSIRTQGGDVSPMVVKDAEGIWRPGATIEIGETYAYKSSISTSRWLAVMKPNCENVGMISLGFGDVEALITGREVSLYYNQNSLFKEVFDELEEEGGPLSLQTIRTKMLELQQDGMSDRFKQPGVFGEPLLLRSRVDEVFTPRALGVMASTLMASGEHIFGATREFLAEFRRSITQLSLTQQLQAQSGNRPDNKKHYER